MARSSKPLLACALAGLALAGGLAYSSRGRDGEARLRRLEAELARANEQLDALERRPPLVVMPGPLPQQQAVAGTAAAAVPAAQEVQPAAADAARASRRDPDAPRRSVEQVAAAMEQRLAAEQPDAAWSGTTEQALRAIISGRATGSALLDVQCRETLCRLVVRHGSPADRKTFAGAVAWEEPFRTGTVYRYGSGSPEAELDTIVYVVREGHDLQGQPRPLGKAL